MTAETHLDNCQGVRPGMVDDRVADNCGRLISSLQPPSCQLRSEALCSRSRCTRSLAELGPLLVATTAALVLALAFPPVPLVRRGFGTVGVCPTLRADGSRR
jgi:hypothetical protein